MPTNVCRKNQKREENLKKQGSTAKSILKTNDKAKTVQCSICKQAFLCTVREPEVRQHVDSKHSKNKFEDCFPTWGQTE
eukprot:NODE_2484_length_530_cov_630.987526_g1974_i0.p1 GENE.NODE_2484_length_530_cov_630.987526_g1974_i0~~NODE_2484_length_530_cov_630.987526_g1974_i0.p1  ORF type:complete len:79 (+),score=6.49 NODE_2484_length_530_cov_630.987526_g1974_i0:87-323(+)